MTAMFPDSGVPYSDARNSLPNPNIQASCNPLWYSTSRCQPRFDAAAANAMLAELVNLINRGEIAYDCTRLDQVERAVRYIVQRGLPCGTSLAGGPFDYTATLDPTATRYNDYMTLIIVPNVKNQGQVRLNVDGLGLHWILRSDNQQLRDGDLQPDVPALISYWAGNWHLVGLARSQVPLLLDGPLDLWIRTDGNDETGDGSANTPDKAFKTIQGAWNKAGSRYAATPLFSIQMRLGIPGTYAGAALGGFGGVVYLWGDRGNRGLYKLTSIFGGSNWFNIGCSNIGTFIPVGLTFQVDKSIEALITIGANNSSIVLDSCDFDVLVSNPAASLIGTTRTQVSLASVAPARGQFNIIGHGHTIESVIKMLLASSFNGNGDPYGAQINVSNLVVASPAYIAQQLSIIYLSNTIVAPTATTGSKYSVVENSILNGNNQPGIGDAAGSASSGGQVSGVL